MARVSKKKTPPSHAASPALVIVESPTKARTIGKFLGSDFRVESSFGHIRDLPKSSMGIDIENNFAPKYVIPVQNRKRVTHLRELAKNASRIYFATDEDREGEAISWHLKELLAVPDEKAERIVFHEITESAIQDAFAHPRSIDPDLVDAQTARRVLDRLVGYELSPFLWRKVTRGLSAGRVQSVAVRLIVEREREITAFVPLEYWSIDASYRHADNRETTIDAKLATIDQKAVGQHDITTREHAESIVSALQGVEHRALSLAKKDVKKSPLPPYTTSTLQQDAYRRLRFSPKFTMMIAQQLYEGVELSSGSEGLITYMRTDSVNCSQEFLTGAQEAIAHLWGGVYAKGERRYKTKSKTAQEAHEAIRPTSPSRFPDAIRASLTDEQFQLYDLVWRRAIASQMPDALFEATTLDVSAQGSDSKTYGFRANGQVCRFDGFLKAYHIETEEKILPRVSEGDRLDCTQLESSQHFTKPPSRYSEASLVKALEERGIGRPSTYAPTISTIMERNYVQKEEGRLKPTDIACLVTDLLVEHFPAITDYDFTARMEDDLDSIAEGEKQWVGTVKSFYDPFHATLLEKDQELKKTSIAVEETDKVCEKCGKAMVIRTGRFGKFLACTGFPECKNAQSLDAVEKSEEMSDIPPCEKCGAPMIQKRGRFGPFLGCSRYPECKNIRSSRDKRLNMPCPTCQQGEIVQKRSKRGRFFYGCSRYPECDFVSWIKPGDPQAGEPTAQAS